MQIVRNIFGSSTVYRGSSGDFGSSRIIFGEYSDLRQSSGTKNRLFKIPAAFRILSFPAYRKSLQWENEANTPRPENGTFQGPIESRVEGTLMAI